MSHSFIDRNSNYFTQNYENEEPQKDIDPWAQLKELENTTFRGRGLLNNPPAQMFAKEEENDFIQGKGLQINNSPVLENEADEMGAKAAQGKMVDVAGTGSGVQKQVDENVITEPDPIDRILQAVALYRTGYYSMPEFARAVLPYVEEHSLRINSIFSILNSTEKDNFAYALAANSTDLMIFDDVLLKTMSEVLDTYYTFSREDNLIQKKRVDEALAFKSTPAGKLEILLKKESLTQEEITEAKALIEKLPFAIIRNAYYKRLLPLEAAENLKFTREHFNNNLTGGVGVDRPNKKIDVQLVARGLKAKGYDVSEASLNDGICDDILIAAIKKFQTEVQGLTDPDGAVDANGTTLKKIFDKDNNSYSSGLSNMYGDDASDLNASLTGNPLETWKRSETFNTSTGNYDYSIDNDEFIDQETYLQHIEDLAKAKGVEEGSDNSKVLGMAARASGEVEYFNEFTKNVGYELKLSNETAGSHQVNSVLKDRLTRFHKFISAIGLFRGDMTGSACRVPSYAHQVAIPHVVCGGVRPQSSVDSVRNNLIKVYNDETVNGGIKESNGDIEDTDGYVWAKSEHFNTNDEGKAQSMKDSIWFTHIKAIQPGRDWTVLTAEGYKKGDPKRFPLGLNNIPGRSNHITGDAIDINSEGFTNKDDAMIDLIALNFGLIRPVPGEQWHFECTNVQLSTAEKELVNANTREFLTEN